MTSFIEVPFFCLSIKLHLLAIYKVALQFIREQAGLLKGN